MYDHFEYGHAFRLGKWPNAPTAYMDRPMDEFMDGWICTIYG